MPVPWSSEPIDPKIVVFRNVWGTPGYGKASPKQSGLLIITLSENNVSTSAKISEADALRTALDANPGGKEIANGVAVLGCDYAPCFVSPIGTQLALCPQSLHLPPSNADAFCFLGSKWPASPGPEIESADGLRVLELGVLMLPAILAISQ